MGAAVGPSRARMVARYLRSHSGIPSIQGPVGKSSLLMTPDPYVIRVTASRGIVSILARAGEMRDSSDMWTLVSYTKDTSLDEAHVLMNLRTFAAYMQGFHENARGAFNDEEGR